MNQLVRWVETIELPPSRLIPHTAALLPIADDDEANIRDSMEHSGQFTPITVRKMQTPVGAATHQILFGVNRWRQLQAAKAPFIRCEVVTCNDPETAITEELMARRKGSTGQRVLKYVQTFRDKVLAANTGANAIRASFLKKGKNSNDSPSVSRDTDGENPWTAVAISKRLHCSNKDVLSAVDLLRAEAGETDKAKLIKIELARDRVLSGQLPIRRWAPAVAGGMAPQKGKATEDLGSSCLKHITGVEFGFTNNARIRQVYLSEIAKALASAVSKTPSSLVSALVSGIDQLPDESRKLVIRLVKQLPAERQG